MLTAISKEYWKAVKVALDLSDHSRIGRILVHGWRRARPAMELFHGRLLGWANRDRVAAPEDPIEGRLVSHPMGFSYSLSFYHDARSPLLLGSASPVIAPALCPENGVG